MFYVFVIKDIREYKGISLNKLSKKAHIARTYISELELNKKTNPSISALCRIADALEVNVKDLFYTSNDIDFLKEKLDENIEMFGLQSREVAQISKIIDTLVTLELQEEKNLNNEIS